MVKLRKLTVNLGEKLFSDLERLSIASGCPITSLARTGILEFVSKCQLSKDGDFKI